MSSSLVFRVMLVLGLMFSFGFAQKISFPAEKPVLVVDFPKDWSVELDNSVKHGVIAMSPDGNVEIDLWMLDQRSVNKDPKAALLKAADEVDTLISDNVKNFKVIERGDGETNGIKYSFVDGEGKYIEDGKKVNVYIEFMSPDNISAFVMLYWATPSAETKYQKDIDHIFKSLKRVQ